MFALSQPSSMSDVCQHIRATVASSGLESLTGAQMCVLWASAQHRGKSTCQEPWMEGVLQATALHTDMPVPVFQ